jgi:general secretion pathway protein J
MRSARGLTLIEVLVALTIMAIMAALAWQSIDTMVRIQTLTREQGQATQRLLAGLEQWVRDLDDVQTAPTLPPGLQYDGLVLRLLRRDGGDTTSAGAGLRVVAWAVRPSAKRAEWTRWQSRAVSDSASLRQAWERAGLWARGGNVANDQGDSATPVTPAERWQVFFHRGGSWVNPQSEADGGAAMPPGQPAGLPDGVRVVLEGLNAPGLSGRLQRDWVQPVLIPSRS